MARTEMPRAQAASRFEYNSFFTPAGASVGTRQGRLWVHGFFATSISTDFCSNAEPTLADSKLRGYSVHQVRSCGKLPFYKLSNSQKDLDVTLVRLSCDRGQAAEAFHGPVLQ